MFEPIFDSMRKAIELNLQFQQDLFKRWAALWPGAPSGTGPSWVEQAQKFQKRWAEAVADLARQQRETMEAQFTAGMKQIEEAYHLAEVKDVETLRARALEMWQKTFQLMQQFNEAQIRNFQAAIGKWAEMMTPAA